MIRFLFIVLLTNCLFTQEFSALWNDGRAEISIYELHEKHYGEWRKGHRILIFVKEAVLPESYIKVDDHLQQKSQFEVLKMNDIRKFDTGIYEYSVMSSLHSCLQYQIALHLSFTSQEWCGTIFEEILRRDFGFRVQINNYFETVGRKNFNLTTKKNVDLEENLWVVVRELQKTIQFDKNNQLKMYVVPSSWHRIKDKKEMKVVECILRKQERCDVWMDKKLRKASRFSWTINGETTSVWVEKSPEKLILQWENSYSRGKLKSSVRNPYWENKSTKSDKWRSQLHLPQSNLKK